jgi:hypothetical protein
MRNKPIMTLRCDKTLDDLIPCENEKFCQQCDKMIIDFRALSDKAIADKHRFSDTPVCGIYRKDQVQFDKSTVINQTRGLSTRKWLFASLGLLGFIFPINGETAPLDFSTVQVDKTRFLGENNFSEWQDSIPKEQKYIIHGTCWDEDKESLISVSCMIKNTTSGTITDLDGKYEIDVSNYLRDTSEVTLIFSYMGYRTIERKFQKGDNLEINLIFEEGLEILNDVVVVGLVGRRIPVPEPKKLTFWDKVKNIFKRKNKN